MTVQINSLSAGARRMFRSSFIVCFISLLLASIASAQDKKAAAGESLFNGKNLDGWKVTDFGGEGEIRVEDGQIIMRMGQPMTGITIADGSKLPTDNFEIT